MLAVISYCAMAWVGVGLLAYMLAVDAERMVIGEVPVGSWAMLFLCIAAGPFCFVYVAWNAWRMYRSNDGRN